MAIARPRRSLHSSNCRFGSPRRDRPRGSRERPIATRNETIETAGTRQSGRNTPCASSMPDVGDQDEIIAASLVGVDRRRPLALKYESGLDRTHDFQRNRLVLVSGLGVFMDLAGIRIGVWRGKARPASVEGTDSFKRIPRAGFPRGPRASRGGKRPFQVVSQFEIRNSPGPLAPAPRSG